MVEVLVKRNGGMELRKYQGKTEREKGEINGKVEREKKADRK